MTAGRSHCRACAKTSLLPDDADLIRAGSSGYADLRVAVIRIAPPAAFEQAVRSGNPPECGATRQIAFRINHAAPTLAHIQGPLAALSLLSEHNSSRSKEGACDRCQRQCGCRRHDIHQDRARKPALAFPMRRAFRHTSMTWKTNYGARVAVHERHPAGQQRPSCSPPGLGGYTLSHTHYDASHYRGALRRTRVHAEYDDEFFTWISRAGNSDKVCTITVGTPALGDVQRPSLSHVTAGDEG